VPAARSDGLGALVADSQPPLGVGLVWLAVAALAVLAVPDRPWQGPLGVGFAAAVVAWLSARTARRLAGVTGDVLGAAAELATAAVLTVCSFGPG
jgi:adenosylcobinamide-GDP ribazoletransferase